MRLVFEAEVLTSAVPSRLTVQPRHSARGAQQDVEVLNVDNSNSGARVPDGSRRCGSFRGAVANDPEGPHG